MQLMKAMLHRNATKIILRNFSTKVDPKTISESDLIEKQKQKEAKEKEAYNAAKSFKEIPGPPSLSIGSLYLYYWPFNKYSFQTLHLTYEKMCLEYGTLVKEKQSPGRTILHVFAEEDIRTIYYADGKYPCRISHRALGKYRKERPHIYAREGLLSSNKEEWDNFRELFAKEMLVGRTEFRPIIEDVIDEMLETFPRRLDEKDEISVMPLFYKWGLEIIGRIMLNKRIGCLDLDTKPEVDALINAAQETHIATYMTENLYIGKGKYHKMLQKAQDIFSGIVGRYLDEAFLNVNKPENQNCVLASILAENPNIDRRDVLTMMIDAFLGSIDNTSCALSMVLYNLAKHKEVQDTMRKEVMKAMPTKDRRIAGLKTKEWQKRYTSSVIEESHRLTPATVGNGRLTQKNLVLSGYQVPANTCVILQHQVASKLERHFTDAHLFMPERHNLKHEMNFAELAIRPFGFGRRTCIGFWIAKDEILLAVTKFVRNYELSYHHEDVGFRTILMNKPDKPVKLRFKKVPY